jgi:Holliday junction resolvase YEN1
MSAPFLPLFIFDGPKRPKIKRGKRISGEKHWLVDSMKGIIEAFGFEWRMVRLDSVVLGSYRLSYLL